MYFSVLGMALPSFFSAILIAWVFGYLLHAYTGLSMTGSLYEIDDYGISRTIQFKNVILPALTLRYKTPCSYYTTMSKLIVRCIVNGLYSYGKSKRS